MIDCAIMALNVESPELCMTVKMGLMTIRASKVIYTFEKLILI